MTIKIKIGSQEQAEETNTEVSEPITIKVGETEEKEPQDTRTKAELQIRKTLDGNLIILDHEDIDIVVMPDKKKILTLISELLEDKVYDTQNRFFKYLQKRGLIDPMSIKSGYVYGSLEAKILESSKVSAIDLILLSIDRWMEDERPLFMYKKALDDQLTDDYTDPDEEDSTELGEVPQKERKGFYSTPYSYTTMYEGKKK